MMIVLMLRRVEVGDRVYEAGERAELGRAQAQVLMDLGLARDAGQETAGLPGLERERLELAVVEKRELAVSRTGGTGRTGSDGGGV